MRDGPPLREGRWRTRPIPDGRDEGHPNVCNLTGIAFGETVLTRDAVAGREVLDVGALDVNGSLRPFVESLGPDRYVGVDIAPGPSVDEVVDASRLVEHFGAESFDLVITTEMIEHIRDWQTVVANLKRVVRPGGLLLVTTRSIGFHYHGYPFDFWRYEPEDMRAIFADFEILALERDTDAPGVFMLARKPDAYVENRAALALFSIISGRRQVGISTVEVTRFRLAMRARAEGRSLVHRARRRTRRWPGTLRRRVVGPTWRRLPQGLRSGVKRVLGRG
jgi:SAM-dependent methyltransferase